MAERRYYFREWRKSKNFTQKQVVDRLAMLDDKLLPTTEASLSRLETGKQQYSQRVLEALAEIYQTEPEYLLGRDPTKEGKLIDLVAIMDERQQARALAILEALAKDESNGG